MAYLDGFFAALRERIVPLIRAIGEKEPPDDAFLHRHYPVEAQRRFSEYLMEVLELDRNYCGLGETEHPFTEGFNNKDVRITTHYHEDNMDFSMYSVIHEGGHAKYELGICDEVQYTSLAGGVSMGVHESQSRFYENLIGRSLPFIQAIGESTGWYTYTDLMNMLAVSESTPGPIGINMATYVGFTAAGIPGAVIATLGEVTPSIIVILIVAAVLHSFRNNPYVDRAFYGLRPASTGLIGAACAAVALEVLTSVQLVVQNGGIDKSPSLGEGSLFNLPGLLLAAALIVLTNYVPKVKGLHPIVFIGLSAVVGIVFGFAGA